MKLICERDALAGVLVHASRRADHKSKIPILQHVLLQAADNEMSVAATNLDTHCVATCPAEISEPGEIAVSADRLSRLIDGMPAGSQVRLNTTGTELHIECGKSRYKLFTMHAADFPQLPEMAFDVEFGLRAADAKRLFGETSPGLPVNDARIYLFGGFLSQKKKGEVIVTAANGLQLVQLSVKNADVSLDRGYIIPKPAMPELVRLAALGDLDIRFNANRIEVSTANVVFTSKLIDAIYPDIGVNIPAAPAPGIKIDLAEFVAAFKRLVGLEDESSTVDISWKPGEPLSMVLSGNGSGAETIACECELEPGTIAFRPNILGAMLDVMKGDVINLIVTGPNSAMRIYDENDPDLVVLAMPCKGRG